MDKIPAGSYTEPPGTDHSHERGCRLGDDRNGDEAMVRATGT